MVTADPQKELLSEKDPEATLIRPASKNPGDGDRGIQEQKNQDLIRDMSEAVGHPLPEPPVTGEEETSSALAAITSGSVQQETDPKQSEAEILANGIKKEVSHGLAVAAFHGKFGEAVGNSKWVTIESLAAGVQRGLLAGNTLLEASIKKEGDGSITSSDALTVAAEEAKEKNLLPEQVSVWTIRDAKEGGKVHIRYFFSVANRYDSVSDKQGVEGRPGRSGNWVEWSIVCSREMGSKIQSSFQEGGIQFAQELLHQFDPGVGDMEKPEALAIVRRDLRKNPDPVRPSSEAKPPVDPGKKPDATGTPNGGDTGSTDPKPEEPIVTRTGENLLTEEEKEQMKLVREERARGMLGQRGSDLYALDAQNYLKLKQLEEVYLMGDDTVLGTRLTEITARISQMNVLLAREDLVQKDKILLLVERENATLVRDALTEAQKLNSQDRKEKSKVYAGEAEVLLQTALQQLRKDVAIAVQNPKLSRQFVRCAGELQRAKRMGYIYGMTPEERAEAGASEGERIKNLEQKLSDVGEGSQRGVVASELEEAKKNLDDLNRASEMTDEQRQNEIKKHGEEIKSVTPEYDMVKKEMQKLGLTPAFLDELAKRPQLMELGEKPLSSLGKEAKEFLMEAVIAFFKSLFESTSSTLPKSLFQS